MQNIDPISERTNDIPEAPWSGITMTFHTDAAMLADIKLGDQITFDVVIAAGGSEMKAIREK
ncbi:copper-binding protein [Sphingopyxis sp. BSNA05]|uniref:copper-binding protein n=1 Tax=Sphingomonadales TaxID=204457 RepID=UPI00349F82F9